MLRASGSQVFSAVLGKSDGMNSYLEREQKNAQTLNADAETFVPVPVGQHISGGDQLRPHLLDVRSKVRNVDL